MPGNVVIATADRVMQQGSRPRGWIGVQVQPLSSRLASALGANVGAVVSWVDPRGPAAALLSPTDVVEQIDGTPVVTTGTGIGARPVSRKGIPWCSWSVAEPIVARFA